MLPLFEELKIWYFILPWVGVNKTTGCTKGVRRNVTSSQLRWHHRKGRNVVLVNPFAWTYGTSRVKKNVRAKFTFSTVNAPFQNSN
jgi:hypothetical protein